MCTVRTYEKKKQREFKIESRRQNDFDNLATHITKLCGPGSSVGIATGDGLDGPGIESRWVRDFPHLSKRALGPTQPPVQ
jgi:hypothetical protein